MLTWWTGISTGRPEAITGSPWLRWSAAARAGYFRTWHVALGATTSAQCPHRDAMPAQDCAGFTWDFVRSGLGCRGLGPAVVAGILRVFAGLAGCGWYECGRGVENCDSCAGAVGCHFNGVGDRRGRRGQIS